MLPVRGNAGAASGGAEVCADAAGASGLDGKSGPGWLASCTGIMGESDARSARTPCDSNSTKAWIG